MSKSFVFSSESVGEGHPDKVADLISDSVLDACLAVVSAKKLAQGAVYNVGTGKQTTLADVVETVRALFKLKLPPTWSSMPDRRWDTDTWVADNRLIRPQSVYTGPVGLKVKAIEQR